jgi:hypothetical protein
MCMCGLINDYHWYSDPIHAPNLWQVSTTPEEAEHSLRSWAGKVLKLGHQHIDMKFVAARVLGTRVLSMIRLCEGTFEVHPGVFE